MEQLNDLLAAPDLVLTAAQMKLLMETALIKAFARLFHRRSSPQA